MIASRPDNSRPLSNGGGHNNRMPKGRIGNASNVSNPNRSQPRRPVGRGQANGNGNGTPKAQIRVPAKDLARAEGPPHAAPMQRKNYNGQNAHQASTPPPPPRGPVGALARQQNGHASERTKQIGTPSSLLIHPTSVCKVIKGEIHNVLNAMRADARYVSPLRFVEELPTDEHHPLLLQFRDLHSALGEWEVLHHQQQPDPQMYLQPFCSAIQGRDISARITGAALNALHKFLLYGFLNATNSKTATRAFATIADALLLCTFEETTGVTDAVPRNQERPRRASFQIGTQQEREDEQVVLKLLELSALIVRYSSHVLETGLVVGLLDTCLHVSHRAKRASGLLKSAASDALGQMVLHIFCQPDLLRAREAILAKLASLLNPQQSSDAYAVNSLTLVNIALETMKDDPSPNEVGILQNDLCKFLLQWSTTHDLVVLSLALRVIFNLFQTIRNHIKVPLEVFLTSVHLRILEHSQIPEEREVVLESLLEFCQEPALMKDIYLNYDCDVQCTNLYDCICTTLGNVAAPSSFCTGETHLTVELDRSVESGLKRTGGQQSKAMTLKAAAAAAEVPLNILNILALEGLMAIIDSIARRCSSARPSNSFSGSDSIEDDSTEQITEEELRERKQKKHAWSKVAKEFNEDVSSKAWVETAKSFELVDGAASSIAKMLYSAPGLDKAKIGEYLGLGPAESYPFEEEVRQEFVKLFNFSKDTNFASCLRLFLSKFRMPGEAQCIDRFMEAFSKELYRQQEDGSIFKSSDAVFVLSFSTIMLNTDLHNPTIKDQSRMTCEQFIRNNRGINDGEDLPPAMLKSLYEEIKQSEIQLQREIGEFIRSSDATTAEDIRSAWDDLLDKNVATPLFTTIDEARKTMYQAGVHEKDMFLAIAKPALKSLSSAFVRSWDDGTVVETLKGFEQMAKISTFFGLDSILNDILNFLLSHGREFIVGCISLEFAGIDSGAPISTSPDDDDTMSVVDPDSPIPHALLRVREMTSVDPKRMDISGSAAYRGLLALHMSLKIVRALFPRVREAWPCLIEVLCVLRDARALPPGLADLDDFADSDGNVLPLSPFADESQRVLDDNYRGANDENPADRRGWFRLPLFGKRGRREDGDEVDLEPMPETDAESDRTHLTANAKTLLQVAQRSEIEKFMLLTSKIRLSIVKYSIGRLLDNVDDFSMAKAPTFEQHRAFALELATRALLANRDRAPDLFPLFLVKFQSMVDQVRGHDDPKCPFLLERMVVTMLRSSIHLFANVKMRPTLINSLFIMPSLPKGNFMGYISDRMACGLAIILRSSFFLLKTNDEWKYIVDSFDMLAVYAAARGLVFDGVASTVEFAIPAELGTATLGEYQQKLKAKPTLSILGCSAIQRILFKYIYGAYSGDISLAVPAMECVENTYRHTVKLGLLQQMDGRTEDGTPSEKRVPDKDLWYRVAVAFYSVCKAEDPDICKAGWEYYQRHVMGTEVGEIPDDKWIAILQLMASKQPKIEADVARVHSFSILGQVIVKVIPHLTHKQKNWKVLTDVTKEIAGLAEKNLRFGRQGGVKPLFQYTLQTVTFLSDHMASPDFGGEPRYSAWASQTFSEVLEKVGAVRQDEQ